MLAAVFGILSAMLMFAFLNSGGGGDSDVDKALRSGPGAESVVVAKEDIPAGTEIAESMLEVVTLPSGALLNGRFNETAPLIGKVATAPIIKGEQVVDSRTTTFEGQTSLSYKVPKGMRALALQVPHEAWIAAGLPQPGDRIDILGITTLVRTDPLTGQERPDVVTGYMAQDVEVLAVAQSVVKVIAKTDKKADASASATPAASATAAASTPDASSSAKPLDTGETFEKAVSITLALSPELAAKVALIDALKDEEGQYRILVRQKGDNTPLTGNIIWSFDDLFPKK